MPKRGDMTALGRLGGLARADKLGARRKLAIAKLAADARWKPEPLMLDNPRDQGELQCFVAQYNNGYTNSEYHDVTSVLHRAVATSRDDTALARMLPVFIWRARKELLASERLHKLPAQDACGLGYFFELAFRFGRSRVGKPALARIRERSEAVKKPFVFFRLMDVSMLREHASEMTSPAAKSWNLILGEPDESFAGYFKKAIDGEGLASL